LFGVCGSLKIIGFEKISIFYLMHGSLVLAKCIGSDLLATNTIPMYWANISTISDIGLILYVIIAIDISTVVIDI
jgi:hypothetical protein